MGNPPSHADAKTSGVQSIERAIAILKAFSPKREELGVTELSRQLNLHKSTVSRLLASLQREGLVEENPVTRKYRLGMALVTLGGVSTPTFGTHPGRAAADARIGQCDSGNSHPGC